MTENVPIQTAAQLQDIAEPVQDKGEYQMDETDGTTKPNPEVWGAPSYTEKEERKVRLKMDIFILPVLCLMNLCSYLDKANIGNAKTAGMNKDLGLSNSQFNLLLTLFYVIYTLFQWEFIMLKYVPARYWLSGVVLAFGIASLCQGFTSSFGGMLACRIVIATFEAGAGPAAAFYFSLLYPRKDYGLRWAIYQCTSCLANSFAGAMAYGLVQAKTSLKAWKLVFIVESTPTFLAAILLFTFLPTQVDKCIFLTKRENEIALERLQRGTIMNEHKTYSKKQLIRAFAQPWTWWIALIHFFGGAAFNSLSVFLTVILKDMGYTSINAQGLSAPAWLAAYIVAVTCGYFSDRLSIRGWFIFAGQLLGGVGYLVIAFAGPIGARYFAVYMTVIGVYLAQPIMFSWCSTNGETDSIRAASLILFLITGQCGSIMGSNIYNDAPRYHKGNSVCAAGLFVNCFLALTGIWYLKRENRKKDEKYGVPAPGTVITQTEDGSPHSAWRYVL